MNIVCRTPQKLSIFALVTSVCTIITAVLLAHSFYIKTAESQLLIIKFCYS